MLGTQTEVSGAVPVLDSTATVSDRARALRVAEAALRAKVLAAVEEFEKSQEASVEIELVKGTRVLATARCWNAPVRYVEQTHAVNVVATPWP